MSTPMNPQTWVAKSKVVFRSEGVQASSTQQATDAIQSASPQMHFGFPAHLAGSAAAHDLC